ncbi:hypothetical protein GGR54DRAFT_287364 [Hypoxylon sp. NC1633]|nr:hypothetical protein GGR54DRAFT_287364 [Hypoxylon sp. NC1633]
MAEPLTKVDSAVQGLSQSPTKEKFEPLTKVDSAVQGLSSPPKEKVTHRRRTSSSVAGIHTMKDLLESHTEIEVAIESQGTGWKINTSPTTVEDKDILAKPLVTPFVGAIKLHFDSTGGPVVTAKAHRGNYVTIKDALDAIYKPYKKRADDEISAPYLKGFEWLPNHPQLKDDEEKRASEWDRLYIHLSETPALAGFSGSKKKKKHANAE